MIIRDRGLSNSKAVSTDLHVQTLETPKCFSTRKQVSVRKRL